MQDVRGKINQYLNRSYCQRVIALIGGGLFVYFFLIRTGTLWSGYHFLDDHELVRIEYSLEHGTNVLALVKQWILNDLHSRYRPLYWAERIIGTAAMGSDLYLWNVYKAFMGAVTFYLLYMTGFYLRQKWYISALFSAVIMVGPQITPWYRSANQENTGLFLCTVVLYLLARQYNRQKYRHVGYNIFIAVAVILCSLEKESFILMMPAFGAMKYWLEYTERETQMLDKGNRKGLLLDCLRNGGITYAMLAIGFLGNLYMLLFRVGVDKVSYAGFHKEASLREYINGIKFSLTKFMANYVWFAVIFTLLLIVCYQVIDKKQIKYYLGFGFISCYIMGTQLLAHAKSMMWERYIIPFIIGYAVLFVFVGYHMLAFDALRRRVYVGVITALVLMYASTAKEMAHSYTQDGELIQGYLNWILENTIESDHFIGAYTDEELNVAVACWFETHGRKKMYSYNWNTGGVQDVIQLGEVNQDMTDWHSAEAVVCYSIDADNIMGMMGLTASDAYLRQQYGKYAVIIRQ